MEWIRKERLKRVLACYAIVIARFGRMADSSDSSAERRAMDSGAQQGDYEKTSKSHHSLILSRCAPIEDSFRNESLTGQLRRRFTAMKSEINME